MCIRDRYELILTPEGDKVKLFELVYFQKHAPKEVLELSLIHISDLLEFLRGNPFLDELTLLNHGQRTLDLRGTSIRKLMLAMTGLEELWLGEEPEQLLFQRCV